jgi:adenylate cyclase
MKLNAYKRAFKFDLMTCFIGLILLTIGIVIYSYKINANNTLVLSNLLLNTAINHGVSETIHHLKTAEDSTSLGSTLLANKGDLVPNPQLEQHVIKTLKQTPFLFRYYIADEQGNFIRGYRNKLGSISTELIYQSVDNPKTKWHYRDQNGDIISKKTKNNSNFDPRKRAWYQGAKHSLTKYWTEVHQFNNNQSDSVYQHESERQQLYGISLAHPIIDLNNQFKGVIGVDISLNQLAEFFSSLKIGANGKALVVNSARKIILFSDLTMKQLLSGKALTINDIEQDWVREGAQEFFKQLNFDITYQFKNKNYLVKIFDFSARIGKDWFLIVIIPEDDFLGESKQARSTSLLITSLMLLLSILFSFWLSRNLSRPIENITKTLRQVKNLNFTNLTPLSTPIKEFQQMSDATTAMTHGLKAFLKCVPPALVQQFIEQGEATVIAEHQELNLSFFFSDIEGFTSIAEEVGPKELMTDLSSYFDQMSQVIVLQNQGTIDKYIGDSVMAFWGAPHYIAEHAKHACYAALGCKQAIDQLNQQRLAAEKKAFNTRIGLHTGLAIVGHLGSNDRINYTVIGDNVNLASRIEGLNKIYQTDIIVSQTIYRQVYPYFIFRPLDFIIVKGKNEGIKIYELITEKTAVDELILALVTQANKAFDAYLQGQFQQASKTYQQILVDYPDDAPAKIMLSKCEYFIQSPPDKNWTGATRIFEK